MFRLTVISGPDTGKTALFEGDRVAIGRGPRNDFSLRDGMVSQQHGELIRIGSRFVYRDLRSRHGTLLRLPTLTVTLHDREHVQEAELSEKSHIIVGESLVKVECRDVGVVTTSHGRGGGTPIEPDDSGMSSGDRVLRRSNDHIDAVERRLFSQDARLAGILKLSRRLNDTATLTEILDLVAETTFESFPSASFFTVSVPSEGNTLAAHYVRQRDPEAGGDMVPVPQGLIRQVFETRESVLFVRDGSAIRPTESMINARISACLAAPLLGQRSLLGVMQVDTRGQGGLFGADDLDLYTVLASYTAFAIERVHLNHSILEMFEGIVQLSVSAIDARDPATAGHSSRVADYTIRLAESLNAQREAQGEPPAFTADQLVELRYAALLHDFGKIGVRESVLMKATRLSDAQLAAFRERMEAAAIAAERDAWHAAVEAATRGELPLADIPGWATQAAQRRIQRLRTARDLVLSLQSGRRYDDDARRALHTIAGASFLDAAAASRRLLDDEELRNMLTESGTLNDEEWDDMRSHAARTRELLARIPWSDQLASIPSIAAGHHEKLDGSGYPDGSRGEEIPLGARIMAVADIFDAVTAIDRPYRKASPTSHAIGILRREAAEGQLDANLVARFVEDVVPRLSLPDTEPIGETTE